MWSAAFNDAVNTQGGVSKNVKSFPATSWGWHNERILLTPILASPSALGHHLMECLIFYQRHISARRCNFKAICYAKHNLPITAISHCDFNVLICFTFKNLTLNHDSNSVVGWLCDVNHRHKCMYIVFKIFQYLLLYKK